MLIEVAELHLRAVAGILKFGALGQARPGLVCATLALCEAAGLDAVGLAVVRRLLNHEVSGESYDAARERGEIIEDDARISGHLRGEATP
jgi:hypothetical protein